MDNELEQISQEKFMEYLKYATIILVVKIRDPPEQSILEQKIKIELTNDPTYTYSQSVDSVS